MSKRPVRSALSRARRADLLPHDLPEPLSILPPGLGTEIVFLLSFFAREDQPANRTRGHSCTSRREFDRSPARETETGNGQVTILTTLLGCVTKYVRKSYMDTIRMRRAAGSGCK